MPAAILKVGQWRGSDDSLQPHPNSPTGAVVDLNDGVTFALVEPSHGSGAGRGNVAIAGTGMGQGLALAAPEPTLLTARNPRVVGERVVRRVYDQARYVTVHLMVGPLANWASFSAALHNLQQLCEGISPASPATLQFQPGNGSKGPVYFEADAAFISAVDFREVLWSQLCDDGVDVVFHVPYPHARGARQYLQNLVWNPGFEVPQTPALGTLTPTPFQDNLINTFAYTAQTPPLSYRNTVLADAPLRYYRLDDTTTTAVDSGSGAQNGTYVAAYTQSQTGALAPSDTDAATAFSGGHVDCPATGLPTGAQAVTLECWAKIPAAAGGAQVLLSYGAAVSNQLWQIFVNSSGQPVYDIYGGAGSVTGTLAVVGGAYHHFCLTWDGTTLRGYLDGVQVGSSATPAPAIVGTYLTLAAQRTGASTYTAAATATVDEAAVYNTALSAGRVYAHYQAGPGQGAAPSLNPANTFVDVLQAQNFAALQRYYRLGETSGSTAYDIAGTAQHGTNNNITGGAAGGIAGDTDTAYSFNGTTSYVSCPGNPCAGDFTISFWVKTTQTTAGTTYFGGVGLVNAEVAGVTNDWGTALVSGGKLCGGTGSPDTTVTSTAVINDGAWHHCVMTRKQSTGAIALYVDGAASGTGTGGTQALSAPTSFSLGRVATGGAGTWLSGSLDEVAIWNAVLTAGQVSAIYAAGHTGATGTLANAMTIPAAGRVAFGSPAWGAMEIWQVRFRWNAAATEYDFYLHYTDANNYVAARVTAAQLALVHMHGGTFTTIATQAVALVHESWYWLMSYQYPQANWPDSPAAPFLAVQLQYDLNGNTGVNGVVVGPAAQGWAAAAQGAGSNAAVVGLGGQPQLAAAGAPLVIGGGRADGWQNAVNLWGPGAWLVGVQGANLIGGPLAAGTDATYAPVVGAWEAPPGFGGGIASPATDPAAVAYAGGPVTSYGCARVDVPPAGKYDTGWYAQPSANVGSAVATLPVSSPGASLGFSVAVQAQGLAGGAASVQQVQFQEFGSGGVLLRTGTAAARSGNTPGTPAGWTTLSGTYTTGSGCLTVEPVLRAFNVTTPGQDAGGVIRWDNLLVWDIAATGMAAGTMPYCELRAPGTPYQLILSGLLGDVPAPAAFFLGIFLPNGLAHGTALSFALGRRARPSAAAPPLVLPLAGAGLSGTGANVTAVSDAGSWGAFYLNKPLMGGVILVAQTLRARDYAGRYELLARLQTSQTTNTSSGVTAQALYAQYAGPILPPFAAANAWTTADVGPLTLPISPLGALTDPSNSYGDLLLNLQDSSGGAASTALLNWIALLPRDGGLLAGKILNGSSSANGYTSSYDLAPGLLWCYADGLGVLRGDAPSFQFPGIATAASAAAPWPGLAGVATEAGYPPSPLYAGPANPGNAGISGGSLNDPYLTLDPTTRLVPPGGGSPSAVNELLAVLSDPSGTPLGVGCDVVYYPLYHLPL